MENLTHFLAKLASRWEELSDIIRSPPPLFGSLAMARCLSGEVHRRRDAVNLCGARATAAHRMEPHSGFSAARWILHFSRDPISFLTRAPRVLGDLFAFALPKWMPGRRRKLIFALSAEHHRRVLGEGTAFRGSSVSVRGPRGSALNRLREGFSSRGSLSHASLRKLLWPAFSRKAVEACEREIACIASEQMQGWHDMETRDIWSEMRMLSLRLSCCLLFGNESPQRARALGERLEQFLHYSYFSSSYVAQLNWPGMPFRKLLRLGEQVVAQLDELVAERKAKPSTNTDVLSMIVRGCHEANLNPDLAGPAAFLFVASFETIANSLTWTLFLLAQHPEVMSDLYAEIRGAVGNTTPQSSELEELPLLNAVMKESMRLFPPVPMVYRTATETTELGGLHVNPGDWVICSQYVTQRRPETFPEPQRFLPRRWFGLTPNPYEYFPYGAGSHSCLGQTIGNTILRMCLTLLIQRWRLSLPSGQRVDRQVLITLAPKHGMPMRLRNQDGRFRGSPMRGNVLEMVHLDHSDAAPRILRLPEPVPYGKSKAA